MQPETIYSSSNNRISNSPAGNNNASTSIQYLMLNMDLPEQGTLYDLNQTGALIGINRKVSIGTRLLFKVLPDKPEQRPIGVIATIVREISSTDNDSVYGCQIDRINGLH